MKAISVNQLKALLLYTDFFVADFCSDLIYLLVVLDGDKSNVVFAALPVDPLQLLQQGRVWTAG